MMAMREIPGSYEEHVESARFVTDAVALNELVAELLDEERYGIDTEFHRERTFWAKLALVQISWSNGIALVDPLAVDIRPLSQVLEGPGLAILHAADQDLEVLERSCGAVPQRLFETQIAAGFLGFSSASLLSLVERILGRRLEKGDQLTDWTRRPLSATQLRYAAFDVAHLLDLHDEIDRRLRERGRLEWAMQECALALERPHEPGIPEEMWWKLRQARQFRNAERGIAQEVVAWRERRARETDQPIRFFISDLAIASIAHRPPKSRNELEQVRSIESRHLGGGAAESILEAIARGRSLAPEELHLPPGPQGESIAKPAVAIAAAWVAEASHQLEIDPAILATRADLVAFLQDQPAGRLVSTWRNGLIGEPIRRLVAGEASIVLRGNSLVLEERSGIPIDLNAPAPSTTLTT
jgi:ribonuclease D